MFNLLYLEREENGYIYRSCDVIRKVDKRKINKCIISVNKIKVFMNIFLVMITKNSTPYNGKS